MSSLESKSSNTSKPSRYFITFEGGDGAGKTTLIDRLFSALEERGLPVLRTRAPGGTEVGQKIRDLLLHSEERPNPTSELLLFLADRADHVDKVIKPALERGEIVLCDRFNDSTLAYQGGARGFPIDKLEELCTFATGGLEPTLTLYLDLDPAIGLKRCRAKEEKADQIEGEDLAFHQRIREAFHQIGKKNPARFKMLNAEETPEEVFEKALHLIDVHCFATHT